MTEHLEISVLRLIYAPHLHGPGQPHTSMCSMDLASIHFNSREEPLIAAKG